MNILTFDIEDWFHLLNVKSVQKPYDWNDFECRANIGTNFILDILDLKNVKATFFILGWTATKFPSLIKEIDNRGHHIGTHSMYHQLIYEQTQKEFQIDLKKSIKVIEQLIQKKITVYRAPGFSFLSSNVWFIESLLSLGIEIDSSIFPGRREHGGYLKPVPIEPFLLSKGGCTIKEFPISTIKIFNKNICFLGGGYFRITPSFIIKHLLDDVDRYNVIYLHPRDLDQNQPILPGLSAIKKFKSYVGIKSAKKKFASLNISNAKSLKEINNKLNWGKVPIVNLD